MSVWAVPNTQVGVSLNPDWVTYADDAYITKAMAGYNPLSLSTGATSIFDQDNFSGETYYTGASKNITFAASTGRFTLDVIGTYDVKCNCNVYDTAAGNPILMYLALNGTPFAYTGIHDSSNATQLVCEGRVTSTVNTDYVWALVVTAGTGWTMDQGHTINIKRVVGT